VADERAALIALAAGCHSRPGRCGRCRSDPPWRLMEGLGEFVPFGPCHGAPSVISCRHSTSPIERTP
jgi:hypothetical protein